MPHSGSGAVEFVLSMQNEKDFQGSDEFGVWLEAVFIQSVQHVEEVFDVA